MTAPTTAPRTLCCTNCGQPGAVVTTISGSGVLGHSDGPATTATFYGPQGLMFGAAKQNLHVRGTLYIRVRKVAVADGSVSTVAGTFGLSFNQVGAFPAVLHCYTGGRELAMRAMKQVANANDWWRERINDLRFRLGDVAAP